MKQFLIFITIISIANFAAKAQQANIWYFGDRAGLDFNNTPPTALTNSQMTTHEGCATVSDSTPGNAKWVRVNGARIIYTFGNCNT